MNNKKIIYVGSMFFAVVLGSFITYKLLPKNFKKLSAEKMHERLIAERDYAINQAVKAGKYRCCINPPCTMCYMEGNKWNNYTAGTCACDDFIAKGEEPCPQCRPGKVDIHDLEKDHCDLNSSQAACEGAEETI